MKELKIAVPAGIGDVSWIWSKLSTIPDTVFKIYTPDTSPQRTFQWMHLLGERVIPMIGKHGYNDILMRENLKGYSEYASWKEIQDSHEEGEVIYLQPNQWFLAGKSLKSWMPDLDVDFHYPLYVPKIDDEVGQSLIADHRTNIGIHMACLKGARAWNAWLPEDWAYFLVELKKEFPLLRPVLMGGVWDLDMAMEVMGRLPEDVEVLDLIGRTNIGQAISVLRNLTYYIGFSSGLNVMMNVLDRPCTTLWPKHQRDHMYCHAEPRMIDNRTYLGFVYDDPKRIILRMKTILKKQLEGVYE